MSCSLMHLADTAGHPQVHPQVNTKCLFPNFSIYHKTGFPRIDRFTALYFNIHPYQAADKSPGPGRLTTSQAGSRHLSVINKSQNPILNRQPYSVTKKLPRDFSSSQTIQPRAFTESQLSADTDSVPYAAATPKNAHSSTTNDKLLCEDDSAAPSESEYIENTESTSLFDRISAMYKL